MIPDYTTFHSEQKAAGVSDLEVSARWWEILADNEPLESPSAKYRSSIYRRTAESLRIQDRTGIAVCSCCFEPLDSRKCKFHTKSYL